MFLTKLTKFDAIIFIEHRDSHLLLSNDLNSFINISD